MEGELDWVDYQGWDGDYCERRFVRLVFLWILRFGGLLGWCYIMFEDGCMVALTEDVGDYVHYYSGLKDCILSADGVGSDAFFCLLVLDKESFLIWNVEYHFVLPMIMSPVYGQAMKSEKMKTGAHPVVMMRVAHHHHLRYRLFVRDKSRRKKNKKAYLTLTMVVDVNTVPASCVR